MIRLFVALPLPDVARESLGQLCFGVPGARWLDEDQLHITLRFIGEVDGVGFSQVCAVLDEIEAPEVEVNLGGVGFFPPRGEARILWAGAEATDPMRHLRKKVDMALTRSGFPTDRKRWVPHVTLARLKGTPASRLGRFLSGHSLYRGPSFVATEFALYSSEMHPSGAVYTREETFTLKAR